MATKIAIVAAAALLAGISGVMAPSSARIETWRPTLAKMNAATPKPLPEPLLGLMAESAGRAAGNTEGIAVCAWIRDFVRRHGRERAIEIARLRHSDAEIAAWHRACFPGDRHLSAPAR